jgi:regulator of nucleoside diphosphate kinase
MDNSAIYLSTLDHQIVSSLVSGVTTRSPAIERLRSELARAVVLDGAVVPATAIGLNSRVKLVDMDTKEQEEYVLTLPASADPANQRISVLAPVGTALLGYQEGQEIEWPTPGGMRRLKVLSVTRESSAGAA